MTFCDLEYSFININKVYILLKIKSSLKNILFLNQKTHVFLEGHTKWSLMTSSFRFFSSLSHLFSFLLYDLYFPNLLLDGLVALLFSFQSRGVCGGREWARRAWTRSSRSIIFFHRGYIDFLNSYRFCTYVRNFLHNIFWFGFYLEVNFLLPCIADEHEPSVPFTSNLSAHSVPPAPISSSSSSASSSSYSSSHSDKRSAVENRLLKLQETVHDIEQICSSTSTEMELFDGHGLQSSKYFILDWFIVFPFRIEGEFGWPSASNSQTPSE